MRWVGTVRAEGLVLSWSSLEVGGRVRAHWLVRGEFDLELDDGTKLHVASSRDLDIEPVQERHERWSKLEGLAEARMFRATGPAPHTKVIFRTCSVAAGDRVTVVGSVLEEQFEEGTGLRTTAEKRPSRVIAERVVHGVLKEERKVESAAFRLLEPDAVATPDRTRPPISYGMIALAALALLFAGLSVFHYQRSATLTSNVPDFAIAALAMIQAALLWGFHLSHPPGFIHRDKYVEPRPGWVALGLGLLVCTFMVWLYAFWDGRVVDGHLVNNQGALVVLLLVVCVATVGWVALTGFKTLRLINIVLKAKPIGGIALGAWGRISGTVHDPTPVLGGAAMAMQRELEWTDGSGSHDLETTTYNQDGFVVRTDDGEVEIEAGAGVWATDVRRFPQWRGFAGFRVPKDGRLLLSTELIPQGASIVVVGRVQAGEPFVMKNVGVESLLFFATRAGGDPLAVLRRVRLARVMMVVAAVTIGAAGWGIAEMTRDQLPDRRVYIPSED